jgi:ABC-type Mn2+/Zn2+ transport system permease subunit
VKIQLSGSSSPGCCGGLYCATSPWTSRTRKRLGVSPADLRLTALLAGFIVLLVAAFYKELLVTAFDPVLATILRLPTQFYRYLLLIMLAVTIVVALQTVGVALTVAMLVTPAASASLLTRRLPSMMAVAALIGAGSGVLGLYLSYYANIASGPAIVLVCTAVFAVTFLFASQRGVLRNRPQHQ